MMDAVTRIKLEPEMNALMIDETALLNWGGQIHDWTDRQTYKNLQRLTNNLARSCDRMIRAMDRIGYQTLK